MASEPIEDEVYCEDCAQLVAPVIDVDGKERCSRCASLLGADAERANLDAPPKPPWHFKVLLLGTVVYLIYRAIWFGFWISHHA